MAWPKACEDVLRLCSPQGRSQGGVAAAVIFSSTEGVSASGTPIPRRGRHGGQEVSEGGERSGSKRRHSKTKGWGSVGRWVRGVYGNTSVHREGFRPAREREDRERDDRSVLPDPRQSPGRSLRFAV